MTGTFLEEGLVLVLVIVSVPAFIYGLQRLTGRPFQNKLVILLLYVAIFWIYFEIIERLVKHEPEDLWLPEVMVETIGNQVNGESIPP